MVSLTFYFSEKSLSVQIRRGRQEGKLDLTGRGLSEVPQCVWEINMAKKEETTKGFSLDRVSLKFCYSKLDGTDKLK